MKRIKKDFLPTYYVNTTTEQTITDLLIEFDEMGFAPTTVCPNGEKYAIDWRERVRKEFARLATELERYKRALIAFENIGTHMICNDIGDNDNGI